MKKILLFNALIFILLLSFTGCSEDDNIDNVNDILDEKFCIIENKSCSSFDTFIIVDKDTKVMYLVVTSLNKIGIVVLLDEYGNPQIYEC